MLPPLALVTPAYTNASMRICVPARNRALRDRKAPICKSSDSDRTSVDIAPKVLVIGGGGRVGSAATIHMLSDAGWKSPLHVTIAGRRSASDMEAVVEEIVQGAGGEDQLRERQQQLECLSMDYEDTDQLSAAISGVQVVIHTAGPYLGKHPEILEVCIEQGVPVYVDLSDPLEYIEAAVDMAPAAAASGTAAVVSAGAFPGLSNVLAVQLTRQLPAPPADIKFSYFTAGLGGAGTVNLLITNLGFGEPVWTYRGGQRAPQYIGGLEPEEVDFFIDETDAAHARIGRRTVWAWPFPEVCTTADTLGVSNRSDVKMGTAPHAWNVILVAMARVLPRSWWRDERFSRFLADFSQPMVALTDRFVGETHGVRVDVTDTEGNVATGVQGHDSFRVCVGQSCAEFAMHMLRRQQAGDGGAAGVWLPEQLALDDARREELLQRLTTTPGTFTYRVRAPAPAPARQAAAAAPL